MTTVVGLTGNIASGKSTVAALLARNGATVIDADQLARESVAVGSTALAAIATRWPHAIGADGTLDRPALRRIVFSDPAERAALDRIVHPEVASRFRAHVAAAKARGDRVVVYDVPLLFEANRTGDVDVIVLVDAPESVRRARLTDSRGLSGADADAMIAAQMPASVKRAAAHHIIENDGDHKTLAVRVDALWQTLAPPLSRG